MVSWRGGDRRKVAALALWAAALSAGCAPAGPHAPAAAVVPAAPFARAVPAAPVPLLRMPPAALQQTLDLQQRIVVHYRHGGEERRHEVLALLQADAHTTRIAAIAGGQVLARLEWDGTRLQAMRSPWAPRELDGERILNDLQLSLWPLPAIAAALPPGWRIEGTTRRRVLRSGAEAVVEVDYADGGIIVLQQHRDRYRLTISTLATGSTPG